MGKFLIFGLFAFTAQSAQAASFFCQGKYPNNGNYVVAKQQAYPSRLPISQVVVIGQNEPVLDLAGSHQGSYSDIFVSHKFEVSAEGHQATLTVGQKINKIPGCTRAGCDHVKPGRDFVPASYQSALPSYPSCNPMSKLSCEDQAKLEVQSKATDSPEWLGKLNLNGKVTEFTCEQI